MERTPADIDVVRKRAALSRDPSQDPIEMTSAYGTRSVQEADAPSSAGSIIDSPIRPATNKSKSFPRAAKRKVSRDAIASDSDARNIQALSDFLRHKESPPTSFTSIPEEVEYRQSGIFGVLGGRSRRNSMAPSIHSVKSTRSMRSMRSTKSSKSMKGSIRNLLQLPDSAVAMKTMKGGHWHIAICVPGLDDVPDLPTVDDIKDPKIKELMNSTLSSEPADDAKSVKTVRPSLAERLNSSKSIAKSIRSIRKSLSTNRLKSSEGPDVPKVPALPDVPPLRSVKSARSIRDIRKSMEANLQEMPVIQPLQPRSVKSMGSVSSPGVQTREPELSAEKFDNHKLQIAAAIASWQKDSSEFDLPSFLHRLASMASLEVSESRSQSPSNQSFATSRASTMDPEMDLWHNRQMSMDSLTSFNTVVSRDQDAIGKQRRSSVPTITSQSTVKEEASQRTVRLAPVKIEPLKLPRLGSQQWSFGDIYPAAPVKEDPVESVQSVESVPVVEPVKPLESLQSVKATQPVEPVKFVQSIQTVESIQLAPALQPRRRASIESVQSKRKEIAASLRKTNAKATKDDVQTAKVEAYLASRAQTQQETRSWDALETTSEQPSMLDSRASMIRDSATIPASLWQPLRPAPITPGRMWQAESTLLDFEPEQEPILERAPEPAAKSESAKSEPTPEQEAKPRKRTAKEDADLAKDEQMLEITRCLAQLQEQNRLLMSQLATVTNLKSSFSDMASLAEPGTFNPLEGAKRFERNSDLIEF